MSKPTQKTSKASTGQRRSQLGLKKQALATCESCSAKVMPHMACKKCGAYKGRKVVNVEKRAIRRIKKLKPIS